MKLQIIFVFIAAVFFFTCSYEPALNLPERTSFLSSGPYPEKIPAIT
jgi:hypothetical protein